MRFKYPTKCIRQNFCPISQMCELVYSLAFSPAFLVGHTDQRATLLRILQGEAKDSMFEAPSITRKS